MNSPVAAVQIPEDQQAEYERSRSLISIGQMCGRVNRTRQSLLEWEAKGFFPHPIRDPSGKAIGWTEAQYTEWLNNNLPK